MDAFLCAIGQCVVFALAAVRCQQRTIATRCLNPWLSNPCLPSSCGGPLNQPTIQYSMVYLHLALCAAGYARLAETCLFVRCSMPSLIRRCVVIAIDAVLCGRPTTLFRLPLCVMGALLCFAGGCVVLALGAVRYLRVKMSSSKPCLVGR